MQLGYNEKAAYLTEEILYKLRDCSVATVAMDTCNVYTPENVVHVYLFVCCVPSPTHSTARSKMYIASTLLLFSDGIVC